MSDWIKRNQPCLECGSSDALQESTHHFKCFSCNKSFLKKNLELHNQEKLINTPPQFHKEELIPEGDYLEIKTRKITKETCEKFGISCIKYTGTFGCGDSLHYVKDHWCFLFNQYYNGKLVKQKLRSATIKIDMKIIGDGSLKEMFGQSLFQAKFEKPIVIVEGEFDCAVVWQETGYNCISVRNGAGGLIADIKNNIDYISKFPYVIIGMDNDVAGNTALEKLLENNPLEPGKLRIAKWPLKDANELLLSDRSIDIKKAIWNAEEFKPKDLYTPQDLIELALIKPKCGVDTPWSDLTNSIMGWRENTIITIAAADGIGKTEIADEIIYALIEQQNKVWLYSCEQEPEETLRRQTGKTLNLPLHIPGMDWDATKMRDCINKMGDKLIMWRPEKSTGVEEFISKMRFAAIAYGVRYFLIDHLKGIESQMTDVNNGMGRFISDLKHFAKTNNACIILLAHVAKDKKQGKVGKDDESWNRGRVPTKENIYGSSAISAWSDVIIGASRNVESDSQLESCVTKLSILKNRLMGNRGQKSVYLKYVQDTGRLIQTEPIDYEEE